MPTPPIIPQASGAFVERFELEPTGQGALDGLTFAIKDLMDVAGHITGCGNPSWAATHPPAVTNAVCVDQILEAGARGLGKTVTDEMAFSLIGENVHFGTPLNPRAPDRVPGGSSSGSASAVARGLCDFALGTDTGGSVRVPAANCGIFGFRPSHGRISVAGVNPFAPGFDTVGLLARTADVLARAGSALLGCEVGQEPRKIGVISILEDGLKLTDPEVHNALIEGPVARLSGPDDARVQVIPIGRIVGTTGGDGLQPWCDTYNTLQWAEIWSTLGAWIEDVGPAFGPIIAGGFARTKHLDRRTIGAAVRLREQFARRLDMFLGPSDLLCIPTAPTVAPLKGRIASRSQDRADYYPRALSLTAIAGLGRLPQVTLPVAEVDGAPVGLSFLAGYGRDAFLLEAAGVLAARLVPRSS